jgi:ABC-type dipeptide/oligopeptide/nickel transport system ATPase component
VADDFARPVSISYGAFDPESGKEHKKTGIGSKVLSMGENLLEIRKLKIQIRNSMPLKTLVHGVDLSIAQNTICALVGDSGSGKSLVALSIMGIFAENLTTEGEILFQERNLLSLPEKHLNAIRGRHIGIVMQNCAGSLNPLLKNGKQLSLVIREHCYPKNNAGEVAVNTLEKVRLQNPKQVMKEYPHELSGGMKQRLLTAIGMVCSSELLIMDEPGKGMDFILRNQIADMILALRKETGITILLITHDLEMAYKLSDYCYVMKEGKISTHGDTRSLFDAAVDQDLSDLLTAEREMNRFFPGKRQAEAD